MLELPAVGRSPPRKAPDNNVKGHPKALAALKSLLKYQLTTINQSFLHARMCLDWGYEGLARHIRKDSIANMVFAEELIDRILFLESMPSLRDTYKMAIGQDVAKIHTNDLDLANATVACANDAVATCTTANDDTSRELVERILLKEEDRVDWLESQLKIIDDTGLGLYLSQQLRKE